MRHDHRTAVRPVAGGAHPEEDLHDAVADVVEVRGARREVLALGRDEELAERLERADDGALGGRSCANRVLGQMGELGIGRELRMRLEDLGLVLARRLRDRFRQLPELGFGSPERPEEARKLLLGRSGRHLGKFREDRRGDEDERRRDRRAGRRRSPRQPRAHEGEPSSVASSSPNLDSTRATSSASVASAPSPSTLMRIWSP